MSPLKSRTFLLCMTALLGFFVVSLIMKHEIDGAELALVIGAVAGLYGINDLAGGYREGKQQTGVPDTVATADTINVNT